VLADRLETLVGEGLLQTRVYQERPRRHEYHLTAMGLDLIPALLALMQWGDRWRWPDGRGPVEVVHEQCGHVVGVEVRCPHCERALAPAELRARPRAGGRAPRSGEPGHVSGRRLGSSREGIRLQP
jgi:hypothetical protein